MNDFIIAQKIHAIIENDVITIIYIKIMAEITVIKYGNSLKDLGRQRAYMHNCTRVKIFRTN